jgi:predicted RNase H-like HicB family nuclease
MRYAVVIERGDTSFGAYVPSLPGCVAVGDTREEVIEFIREAIEMHLEAMRDSGEAVAEPAAVVEYVEVAA